MSEPTDEQPPVVREQQTRNRPTGQGGKRIAAEKLARRLDGLPGGRYALMITVGEDGVLIDWTVHFYGKVERP